MVAGLLSYEFAHLCTAESRDLLVCVPSSSLLCTVPTPNATTVVGPLCAPHISVSVTPQKQHAHDLKAVVCPRRITAAAMPPSQVVFAGCSSLSKNLFFLQKKKSPQPVLLEVSHPSGGPFPFAFILSHHSLSDSSVQ